MSTNINQNSDYVNILQNKLTNTITLLTTKSFMINGDTARCEINGIKFYLNYITRLPKFKFDVTVKRLLDILILKLTPTLPYKKNLTDIEYAKYQKVTITLNEYMEFTNTKNTTRAIEIIKNALNHLNRVQVEFTDTHYVKKNKSEREFLIFSLTAGANREKGKGIYSIVFSLDFIKYLANYSYVMPYPLKSLQINLRNYPFAYGIGRRLALHHNMNIRKSNADIISVKSLLESLSLPTYEEVLNGSGNITRYIIEPFNKNMNHLLELNILDSWSYSATYKNYNDWYKSYVKFHFNDYPVRETITKS